MPLYGAGIAISIIVLAVGFSASAQMMHYESVVNAEHAAYQSLGGLGALHSDVLYLEASGECGNACLNATVATLCRSDSCTASYIGNGIVVKEGNASLLIRERG